MRHLLVGILAFVLAALSVLGAVKLNLKDGRVLEGTDVRREGGNYVLTLEDGGVVPIPEALVENVGLSGDADEEGSQGRPPVLNDGQAEGQPKGYPTGLTEDKQPRQLAGDPARPPTTAEQTRVLGPRSEFQKGVVDPTWHPSSDWETRLTDSHRNDFAPSQWSESVIDPEWVPDNAYPDDKVEFAPSEFKENIIDPSWTPQNAFKSQSSWP